MRVDSSMRVCARARARLRFPHRRSASQRDRGRTHNVTATEKTMYERIGGAPALREAVDRVYRRLLEDPELAGYFTGDLTGLKQHQAALLAQVLGGPSNYGGRDLAAAHASLGITTEHIQRVAIYFVGLL